METKKKRDCSRKEMERRLNFDSERQNILYGKREEKNIN